nr:T7-like internal core protein [uncultured Mediterranean phage uvMED]
MNEEFDPTIEVGISGMGMSEEETAAAVANIQAADQQKAINNEIEDNQEEVAKEANAPEEKKGHTFGDYAADTLIGLGSGGRQGVSNVVTAPERVIDYVNGEMSEEEAAGGYEPEWDDFMYGDGDPIVTKTGWGQFVETTTEVATTTALAWYAAAKTAGVLGVAGVAKAAGAAKAAKVAGAAKKLSKGKIIARELKRGAAIGGTYSTLDQNETGKQNNIFGQIAEKYPQLRTPLATNDVDGPVMRKLKFVLEDLGIGAVFDVALVGLLPVAKGGLQQIGKATVKGTDAVVGGTKELGEGLGKLKNEIIAANPEDLTGAGQQVRNVLDTDVDDLRSRYAEYTQSRRDSVELQTRESVKAQVKEPGVRFPKNEPIGSRELGNSTSNHSAKDVDKAIKQKKTEWGNEDGHVGSMVSNQQIEDVAKGKKKPSDLVKAILGDFKGEKYMDEFAEEARKTGRTINEVVAENMAIAKEIYEGRNTSNITSKEFYERITMDKTDINAAFKDPKTGKITKENIISYVKPEYIKALDMVNVSLFNDIQAQSLVGRELADITDIKDIDGPVHHLVDKLITGLKLRKESSSLVSEQLSDFGLSRVKGIKKGKQVSGDFKTLKQFKKAVADAKKAAREANEKQVQDSIDAFRMAMELTPEQGGDDLFRVIFEGISMADGVHTLDDLDVFMRKKMRGGYFGDEKKTGALLREAGTMFTHSVLSGPKTSVRATLGTGTATFTRPMAMALGGAMKGDMVTARAGLAAMNAMREAVPEAFTLFKKKLNGYWSGELSTLKTRYVERSSVEDQWKLYGTWAEQRGNVKDKALFRMANMIRGMNDSSLLTYSTKIMASTDDAFSLIIGRSKARQDAFLEAAAKLPDGNFQNFDAKFFRDQEDIFNSKIFDSEGNLTNEAANYARQEATLTAPLKGFGKNLATAFDNAPWARPFFLFARTGINGLQLTAKHTPGFNFLVDEFNQIARTQPGMDLGHLKEYGIESSRDLINAKAVQNGRLAIGSGALFMASMAYLGGGLHGNGPTDRKQRQAWLDMGWKPRTIKIGDVWVNYDAFEPYNQILALVGDIGDHQQLMGEEWAEDRLSKLAMALAGTATSKSYLAGMQSFVDLFSGQPGQQQRIIASLMNNTVPLSSLRNEIGKVLTPYTRELGSDIESSIRNRNLATEMIAGDPLPIKYDILTGKPIKDHDFVTRMFNAVSPINFNLDYSEGREMLFNSGYDMRTSTYSAPDGTDLSDSPKVRSMLQKAIGEQNLLAEFDKMAADPTMQASLAEMEWYKKNGMKDVETKSFPHYKRIARTFDKAKKRAWASIKNDNDVQKLIIEERNQKLKNRKANQDSIDRILELPK